MGRKKGRTPNFLSNLKEGRVRSYIKRKYGKEAFDSRGRLKISYLRKALKEAKDESLKRAIKLAITMKTKWKKPKPKKK
ncbi:MAG: hypothetical protein DRO11_00235 [Methanobacteriota archaeon]|nr:MAG: hypothetical protein DRO11_00235 [Euryarchaeota archaeon]